MIHDRCDYCQRDFGWTEKPVCLSCGLENVRPETAALGTPERALAHAKPAPRKRAAPKKRKR